jgi:hypothetical protein
LKGNIDLYKLARGAAPGAAGFSGFIPIKRIFIHYLQVPSIST